LYRQKIEDIDRLNRVQLHCCRSD